MGTIIESDLEGKNIPALMYTIRGRINRGTLYYTFVYNARKVSPLAFASSIEAFGCAAFFFMRINSNRARIDKTHVHIIKAKLIKWPV